MNKKVSWYTTAVLMLLSAVTASYISAFAVLHNMNSRLDNLKQQQETYSKFTEISKYIDSSFVGEYDKDKLMDGAMKGYVDALGDNWSAYLTKDEYEYLKESLSNIYTGVGITAVYSEEQEALLITQVQGGSSAGKAGLDAGNLITGVSGLSVSDIGYSAAVDKIRGKEGTSVTLEIKDTPDSPVKQVTLKREKIMTTVVTSKILDGNIGYIRIENFDANVDQAFSSQLDKLVEKKVSGIIFDVRNNGGGSKDIMVSMLDKLLPEGLIFSMKNKQGAITEDYSDANEINLPMAVLVNKYSYSAAEFFAAALQEYGKAVIIGEKTTGKGYAQNTIPLSDGSGLYLSVQTYYTPKGVNLAGIGVTPDIAVSLPEELISKISMLSDDQDSQLKAAMQNISQSAKSQQ